MTEEHHEMKLYNEQILKFIKKNIVILGDEILFLFSNITDKYKIKYFFDLSIILDKYESIIDQYYFNMILEYLRDNFDDYQSEKIIIYQINMYFLMTHQEPPLPEYHSYYLETFIMENYKFRKFFILKNLNHKEWLFSGMEYYKCLYYAEVVIDLIKNNHVIPFIIAKNMINYNNRSYLITKLIHHKTSQNDKLYIVKEYLEHKIPLNKKYKKIKEIILSKIKLTDKITFLTTIEEKAHYITKQIISHIKLSHMKKSIKQVYDFIFNVCMCNNVYAEDIFSYIDKSIVFNNSELMFRLVKLDPSMKWATFHSIRKRREYIYKCIAYCIINKYNYSKYIYYIEPLINEISILFSHPRLLTYRNRDYNIPFNFNYKTFARYFINDFKCMKPEVKLLALKEYSKTNKDYIDKIINIFELKYKYYILLIGMYKNQYSPLFMIQQIGSVKEIIKAFLIGNNIAIEF